MIPAGQHLVTSVAVANELLLPPLSPRPQTYQCPMNPPDRILDYPEQTVL